MVPRTKRKMDSQDLKTAEALGRIEGKLDSFTSRFDRHEMQDQEIARQTDQRLERMEERTIDRLQGIDAKLEDVVTKQTFFAGGWRMLSVIAAALGSLIISVVGYFKH